MEVRDSFFYRYGGPFLEDEVRKVCTRLWGELASRRPAPDLHAVDFTKWHRFDGASVLGGIATCCDEMHWHACAHGSIGDAATFLLCFAPGGCKMHCNGSTKRRITGQERVREVAEFPWHSSFRSLTHLYTHSLIH